MAAREQHAYDDTPSLLNSLASIYYRKKMAKFIAVPKFIEHRNLEQKNHSVRQKAVQIISDTFPMTTERKQQIEARLDDEFGLFQNINFKKLTLRRHTVGIYFGLTRCAIGVMDDNKCSRIIKNDRGVQFTPSDVQFGTNPRFIVGNAAKSQPNRFTVYDIRDIIGRHYNNINIHTGLKDWTFSIVNDENKIKIETEESTFSDPEEILTAIIKYLKSCAQNDLNKVVLNAVVTVPFFFNAYQRALTANACTQAGVNVLRIINEETAVVAAYKTIIPQTVKEVPHNWLLFDFGSKTLQVAVVKVFREKVQLLAAKRNVNLGGDHIDKNVVDYCKQQFKMKHGVDVDKCPAEKDLSKFKLDSFTRQRRLNNECEHKKRDLGAAKLVYLTLDSFYEDYDLSVRLRQHKFEIMNEKIFQECIADVQLVLQEARLTKQQIAEIILVGGSSNIPKIQELLSDYFGGKQLRKSIELDEVIALGVANTSFALSLKEVPNVLLQESFMSDETPNNFAMDDSFKQLVAKYTDHKSGMDNSIAAPQDYFDILVRCAKGLYLRKMQKAIGAQGSISSTDFQLLHSDALYSALEIVSDTNVMTYKQKKVVETILNRLGRSFDPLSRASSNDATISKVTSADKSPDIPVNVALTRYQKEMDKLLLDSKFLSNTELEHHHHRVLHSTLEIMSNTKPLTLEQKQQLKQRLDEGFNIFKENYSANHKQSKEILNYMLNFAKVLYRKEMLNITAIPTYTDSEELHTKHKNALASTLEIVSETMPTITLEQKNKLEEALMEMFTCFEEMNLKKQNSTAPAIGIDLGTTFCCMAVFKQKDHVSIIGNEVGSNKTPSYIAFPDSSSFSDEEDEELELEPVCGNTAKDLAHENLNFTIHDVKRMFGRKWDDVELQRDWKYWPFKVVNDGGEIKIKTGPDAFQSPLDITTILVKYLKELAYNCIGSPVLSAVVTVPAYFNSQQREMTTEACNRAGINVLQLVNEPTAAAVAYKLHHKDDGDKGSRRFLVFDFGGGTLDVAVLIMQGGKIQVLAVDGEPHLGGEDIDNNMVDYCILQFNEKHGVDLNEEKSSGDPKISTAAAKRFRRLKLECERQKRFLAQDQITSVIISLAAMHKVDGQAIDLVVTVSKEVFNEINKDLFERSINVVEKVLADSNCSKGEIEDVVLVGGSSRIPRVQEMLSEFFEGKQLLRTIDADEAVAVGAAMLAYQVEHVEIPNIFVQES